MDKKRLREKAFKEAVLRLRQQNERRKEHQWRITPFIINNFMQGVDYLLELIEEPKDGPKKLKRD